MSDVFGAVLGYVGRPADPYTLRREALVKVDGKFADAGLGRFTADAATFLGVLEGKGPRDPLDRPFAGRKRSAVEQALTYAVQLKIDWYLVTNLKEIRLLHKGHDTHTFERFDLAAVAADDAEFRRFVFLLGADQFVTPDGPHLNGLLTESAAIGQKLTGRFYTDYRDLRAVLFDSLRQHNPGRDPARLLAAAQKILDRVLFVAFCEDRQLLPGEIIKKAFEHRDAFNPRPVWQNFVGLFRAIDRGNDALNIAKYNGGLFADDPFLNELAVTDDLCERFKTLA
ncbi:MAG: Eco57I restriction-modification methylase domain-containing protein, partial [Fimbriiglobus sp.]